MWYHLFIISAAFGPQGGKTMEKARGNLTEVYIIRLEPGSDVLEEIEEACRQYDIKNGVILSGLGGWSRASYFDPTRFPDGRVGYGTAIVKEGLLSLVSISGLICHEEDGTVSPHIHVTLSYGDGTTIGGHLGYGSKVLTTTEVVIGRVEQIDMVGRVDRVTGLPLFHPIQL